MIGLHHDIHFCVTGGRAILLDLNRNRYFALSATANDAFITVVGEHGTGTISAETLTMIMNGAAPCDEMFAAHSKSIPAPTCDRASDQIALAVAPWLIMVAWLATIFAKLAVQIVPLRILLAVFDRRADTEGAPTSHKAADRIGAAFRKIGLVVSNDNNCLPLTLAFVWLCRLSGYRPALIIGVRINPFSAHCWSQDGATVLNDACDRVKPYQPILIL